MRSAGSPAPAGIRPAHRDANALRWVAGYLSSLIGDQVWFVALGWAAVQAGTPAQVGLVLAAGTLPRALLLAAAAAALLLPPSVLVLVVLAGAFGVVDAVFLPATGAMPQQLVAPREMTRLQGMRSTAQRIATTAGAPLGGLIVAAAGAGPAFGVAAAATAVSVLALVFTRVRSAEPTHRQPLLREVRTGLSYVAGHRVLLPLLVLAAVAEFGFSGAINVGLPILAQDRDWGAGGVGVLLGAFGAGATVTALGLVAVRRVPHVGRSLTPIVLVMAAGLAAMGLTESLLFTAASAAWSAPEPGWPDPCSAP